MVGLGGASEKGGDLKKHEKSLKDRLRILVKKSSPKSLLQKTRE